MGRLDGKVAIVTGGGSGIGKGAVELFVAEGARVIVADTNSDSIGALIGQLGHNSVDGAEVDGRDEAAGQRMVAQAEDGDRALALQGATQQARGNCCGSAGGHHRSRPYRAALPGECPAIG